MSSRPSRSKGKGGLPAQPRPVDRSHPEVQISYSPAGHETMAAIHEELVAVVSPAPAWLDDGPEISVVEAPAGRETLALIAEEARPLRAPQDTLNYSDRISNAPGARTPSRVPGPTPEAHAAAPSSSAGEMPFAIFEMLTFVVQGPEIAQLSSEATRRRFVEAHLLPRLPAKNMAQVERVDVTPWTVRGTVVVRVWCKL